MACQTRGTSRKRYFRRMVLSMLFCFYFVKSAELCAPRESSVGDNTVRLEGYALHATKSTARMLLVRCAVAVFFCTGRGAMCAEVAQVTLG